MSSRFEQIACKTVYEGHIATVVTCRFRHEDGEEVTREIVRHPGAVAIVAHDEEQLFLVRQPREAVGVPDLLELPAGKLDEEGETPLDCAQRELAEEIGKAAEHWEHLATFFNSPGFSDEQVHVYLATGLSDTGPAKVDHDERIDIVAYPLDHLDDAIAGTADSKTLIGLHELRRRRQVAVPA
jgi:8-oxo-dGTP pyrophosphatase MutT (NUDIX family)